MKFFTWFNVVFIMVQQMVSARRLRRAAVIGAGASGLYLSHRLYSDYGVTNLDIFESGSSGCESTRSHLINNVSMDLGTIFIPPMFYEIISDEPSNYLLSSELWIHYRNLINRYNLKLKDITRSGMDRTKKSIVSPFAVFEYLGYDVTDASFIQKLGDEFVRLLAFYEGIFKLGIANIHFTKLYELEFAFKGESFGDWGQRHNLPLSTYFSARIYDMAGMTASYNHSAAASLYIGAFWLMPFYVRSLIAFGYTSQHFRSSNPWIAALIDDMNSNHASTPAFYAFADGYQSLWDSISAELKENGVHIYYNSKIVSINQQNNKEIQVISEDGNIYNYDTVIIATRPDDALIFLDSNSFVDEYELLLQTDTDPYYQVMLFDLTQRSKQAYMSANGVYPILPESVVCGTAAVDQIYECQQFYAYTFGDGDYFVSFGFLESKDDDSINKCYDSAFSFVQNEMGQSDLQKTDILDQYVWSLGYKVSPEEEAHGWYDDLAQLQGENGLYFIGEYVTSMFIPAIINYVNLNLPMFYAAVSGKSGKSGENIFISNYESDSTSWYYKAVLSGASDGADVSKFEIQLINRNWFVCDKAMWSNYIVFQCSTSASISLPFSVRLTSTDGNVVTSTNVVNSFRAGHVFDFGQNFYSF